MEQNIERMNAARMKMNQGKTKDKVLVIYYSKTGFTKKYAEWFIESLPVDMDCDLIPYKERKKIQFDQYNIILFGGGFHAGMINGLKWFKTKASGKGKKIAVFATGAMPADAPDVEKTMRQNFTEKEWADIKTFYLPGGLCYENMGTGDKLMMSVFKAMLKKTNADSQMQQTVAHSYDITNKEAVAPMVEWCVTVSSLSLR